MRKEEVDACIERATARVDALIGSFETGPAEVEGVEKTLVPSAAARMAFAGTDLPAAHVLGRVGYAAQERSRAIVLEVLARGELSNEAMADAIRGGYLESLLIGYELGVAAERDRQAERDAERHAETGS